MFYDYDYESNTSMFSKDIARKPFFQTEIKGHNSDNTQWILSIIKLDLYFIIICMCMKYESNTPMFSKDKARKPFYGRTDKGDTICPPIKNGGGIIKNNMTRK